jgi:DNA-binding CsgD family transcriptional regulator
LEVLASGDPPAFAVDAEHRIIFWNRGAERLLGRPAAQALGRRCHELLEGRDVFGNRYCFADCAPLKMLRRGEAVSGFELTFPAVAVTAKSASVTTLRIPGSRPETFCTVHILEPIDDARRARLLARAEPPATPIRLSLAPRASAGGPHALTEREREVLGWVAAGLQNKEVAQELGISLATVRNHVHNILEKLEVHSKLEAVSLAFRNGWTQPAAERSDRTA